MGNFFNMDNAFFTFLSKIWDITVLSLIYIILCLPIITIGPATTALYYTVVKVIRRDRGYVLREFFHSFKLNFKNGAISGVILSIFYIIMYIDQGFANSITGKLGFVFKAILNAILFLLVCTSIYLFPVLSRFTLNLKQLFKTSLFMSIKHFPTTILLAIIIAVFGLASYVMPIVTVIVPGICCLICSFLLEKVFKKYIPKHSNEDGEDYIDEWYLE